MNTVGLSRSSSRTWNQTLGDLLDDSPLESRAFVFDETATNLREVIHGAVALLTPLARRRDLRLSACVDQSVAEIILADGARLGQLVFHLLNRAIQLTMQGGISLAVRAQPLNSGSQRIFIDVISAVKKCAPNALSRHFGPAIEDPQMARWLGEANACLPLCRILARRMGGELSVSSEAGEAPRASFSAPFGVEQWVPSAKAARADIQVSPSPSVAAQSREISASVSFEPFDRRYLDALSEEGVDLPAFLNNWRDAMNEDLERLEGLLREARFEHLYAVLHRLSGAVGLVGATSLMDALRRACTAPREHSEASVRALLARAKALVAQLETTSRAYRSPSR